jgi:hypothetical protein
VQEGEDARWPVRGFQVEIGHASAEQRMALAEVVMDVKARDHPCETLARLVHAQQLRHGLAQRLETGVGWAHERGLRHRVA